MLQTFILNLLVKLLSDERIQKVIKDLLSGIITEKVLPLLPIAVGAAAKAIVDKLPGVEIVGDTIEVANDVRIALNEVIPDWDTGIKAIDDLMDIWRPKN